MPSRQSHPFDDWADIYDRVYARLVHDVPFYVQHGLACGGSVLELGCGTGRVSLAMAQAGVPVVGIDISPRMVETARRKARALRLGRQASFRQADMRTVRLRQRFSLAAMPFRSFQSLLRADEQRQTLVNIKAHLVPGGKLAFDVFAPDIHMLADTSPELFHLQDVPQPDTGHKLVVWGKNRFDHVDQTNDVQLVIEEMGRQGGVLRRLHREFTVRYTFRYEMEHLLEACGFAVEAVYGDFDGGPVTADSDDLVWVARA